MKILILIKQSLKNKLFKKSFLGFGIFLYALTLFMILLPTIVFGITQAKSNTPAVNVAVYSNNITFSEKYITALAPASGSMTNKYAFNAVTDANVESDVVINLDTATITVSASQSIPDTDVLIFNTFFAELYKSEALSKYPFSTEYQNDIKNTPSLVVNQVSGDTVVKVEQRYNRQLAFVIHMVFAIVVLLLLIYSTQIISMEIVDEKSSRVMEIILSSVSSTQHLISKVIAGIIYLFVQLFIMFLGLITGLIINYFVFFKKFNLSFADLASAQGLDINQVISNSVILNRLFLYFVFAFILLLIGVVTYLVIIAVLTSTVSTVEDVSKIQTPAVLLLVISFYYIIFTGNMESMDAIGKILGYIPVMNVMIAPFLFLSNVVGVWYMLGTCVFNFIFMILLFKSVQRPYQYGLLNYSNEGAFSVLKQAFIKKEV